MSYVVIDCESDGPCPPLFSLVCFGAVIVEPSLSKTFFGKTAPITENFNPEALSVSGYSREQHESFDDPVAVFRAFDDWIKENSKGRPIFICDNPCYDWQWINYYFHRYIGNNPFGWSGRRIGDLYCGMVNNSHAQWKHLRHPYEHNHNPVSDALGNAQALLKMQEMGLKIQFK